MTGFAIHFLINFDDTAFSYHEFEHKKTAPETGTVELTCCNRVIFFPYSFLAYS